MPHPGALFSLVPQNEEAEKVVRDRLNSAYISQSNYVHRPLQLDIGHCPSHWGDSLVTLGRRGDIRVDQPYIARLQCSFEIHPESRLAMFHDRSAQRTSQVFGKADFPFELGLGPARKVVVTEDSNTIIGMGGPNGDLIKFELIWHAQGSTDAPTRIRRRGVSDTVASRSLWQTAVYNTHLPTVQPNRFTDSQNFSHSTCRFNVLIGEILGRGAFGIVTRGYNVDTGSLLAVKTIQIPADDPRDLLRNAKRELKILRGITHPHIVTFLGHTYEQENFIIAMSLEEGTAGSLARSFPDRDTRTAVAQLLLEQMLQALDFMAANNLVHRDIKPENILYRRDAAGQYQFRLGDLGLANYISTAKTNCGTQMFIAPEIINHTGQTHKVDIWSLFVAVLWFVNDNGFRAQLADCTTLKGRIKLVNKMRKTNMFAQRICEMGRERADERASAAQMLVKLFNGVGLTTPRENVPEIGLEIEPQFSPDVSLKLEPEPRKTPKADERHRQRQQVRVVSGSRPGDGSRIEKSRMSTAAPQLPLSLVQQETMRQMGGQALVAAGLRPGDGSRVENTGMPTDVPLLPASLVHQQQETMLQMEGVEQTQ